MSRKGQDRQGNPLRTKPVLRSEGRPCAVDSRCKRDDGHNGRCWWPEQEWLFGPPPELPAAPVVPAFSTSADLLSANRKQVAPKREDIKTWSQLKPGYTVWVDGPSGSRPGTVIASLTRTRRQESGGIEILPYCIVRDADNNEEFEVDRLAALRRRRV